VRNPVAGRAVAVAPGNVRSMHVTCITGAGKAGVGAGRLRQPM
jgi:hypothetical protein